MEREKGRREMEWESTVEAPTMVPNLNLASTLHRCLYKSINNDFEWNQFHHVIYSQRHRLKLIPLGRNQYISCSDVIKSRTTQS